MDAISWRNILEAGNGVWALTALWLTVFLIYHLLIVRMQRKIKWTKILQLPLSMQLALGMLVVSISILTTRGIIWYSRYTNNSTFAPQATDTTVYVLGTILGVIGFLCILRTVTRPILGHWPWVGSLLTSGAYLIWWALKLPI